MTDLELYNSFKKIVDENTFNNLKKYLIVEENNGYEVFEKYSIKRTKVGYSVTSKNSDNLEIFSSVKFALAFCTLDYRNKVVETKRICFLDNTLAALQINIKLIEKYKKQTKFMDKKIIYQNKLLDHKLRQTQILQELEYLAQKAKQYHLNSMPKTSYK